MYKNSQFLSGLKLHHDALFFILCYLVLMAPYALQYIFYLPDERHYVDAAIYMLKHGDYMSPHDPDGGYRFLKPIFTYWAVFVSYKLFGISQFSSRFPFLIAAALVLWMTYKIALLVSKDKRVAVLSLFIAGSAPIFNRAVATSLTDIFQLLFLQMMSYGTLKIILDQGKKRKALAILYISAGLAVTVKGIVAIAFLLVCIFFLLVNPWKRQHASDLVHLPALLFALITGSFWYVTIFIKHGSDALSHFYGDQIGYRLTGRMLMIIKNFGYSLIVILIYLFPFLFAGWRSIFFKENRTRLKETPHMIPVMGFFVLWIAAMIGMSSLVSQFYYRYLIPVSHIMAIIFAWFIIRNEDRKSIQKLIRITVFLSFFLFFAVTSGALIVGWKVSSGYLTTIFSCFILIIGISLLFTLKRSSVLHNSRLIFIYMTGLFTALSFTAQPFSRPDQGEQIIESMKKMGISQEDSVQFFGKTRIASRIRVASKGNFYFKALSPAAQKESARYLIFEDTYLDSLNLSHYSVSMASAVWKRYPVEILQSQNQNELHQVKLQNSEKYYIAKKTCN